MDRLSTDSFSDCGVGFEDSVQRNDARDSLLLAAKFRYADQTKTIQARVRNLSSGGLMAEVPGPVDSGAAVEVEVRGLGWVGGTVAWVAAGRIGIAFDRPIDPTAARKPVVSKIAPTKAKPIKPLF